MIATLAGPSCAPAVAEFRSACQEAMNLTGRPYVSHTQLALMRTCPRRYAYQYIERVPRDFQASSLLVGGAMHAAFESWYRHRLEGLTVTAGDLLHAFMEKWRLERQSIGAVPIRFCKGEDMGTIAALARRMIDAFLAAPISRPHGQIVGIEEQFSIVLAPDLPDILARVDLITQTAEALHVVDFKTSRNRWNQRRTNEAAEQLLLYGRTIRGMAQEMGLPVKLHFAVITKAKKPAVQVIDIAAKGSRLDAVRQSVTQVWTAAKSGRYLPHPSALNCVICPFKSRCPAFTHR